jgi:hypothetical protein
MRVATLLAAGVLAAAAAAQTSHTFPRYTNFEGNSNSNFPFTSAQYRYQQVLGEAKGTPIANMTGIAFRRDGVQATTSNGKSLVLTIVMGHASITHMTDTFANNYVGPTVTVVNAKTINLPARQGAPTRPSVWDVVIPFDVPFSYNGSQDLLYELVTSNAGTGTYYIDFATEGQTSVPVDDNDIGTGCIATGRTAPVTLTTTTSVSRTSGGITFGFRGINGPATTIGSIFLIGATNPNLPVVGLCGDGKLYTDALYSVPPQSYSNGTFNAPSISLPWSAAWANLSLYVQAGVIDGGLSNPIKVAVSNGLKITFPPALFPDFTATRLYAASNAATTGTLQVGATVTRFQN